MKGLLQQARADVGTDAELARLEAQLAPSLWPAGGGPGAAGGGAAAAKGTLVKLGAIVVTAGAAGGIWFSATREAPPSPVSPPKHAGESSPPAISAPSLDTPPVLTAPKAEAPVAPARRPGPALSETDLLGQAQAALAKNPHKALGLAEQHRRGFPAGMLAQERDVIAIEALTRMGRTEQARGLAARFLKKYPGSAHRRKVEDLVRQK
jgi:hypothetical protein